MQYNLHRAIILFGIAMMLLPPVSFAQDSGFVLEEIVVTARKVEESLQDSPVSITVISGSALQERDLTNISGIAEMSSNVNFSFGGTTSGSDSAAVVYIRGVGQNDFTPVTDPGVGIYVDGVYLARTLGSVLENLDLQQIEVLKGPQGTVFGRNTIGGAISLTTRDPGETFGGRLSFTTGEDDRYEVAGSIDLPITDTFRGTISALGKFRDGYVHRPDGVDLGDDDVVATRAKFLWEPTADLSFRFTADWARVREESAPESAVDIPENTQFPTFFNNNTFGNGATDPACAGGGGDIGNMNCINDQFIGAPFRNFESGPSRSNVDNYGFALHIDWMLGDVAGLQNVRIKSITAYRDLEADLARASDASPFLIFQTQDRIEQEQFTQELQISSDAWNNRVHWVGGFFYFDEEASQFGLIEAIPPNFPRLIGGATDNDSWSVFGEAVLDVTDRFRLIGGVRHTNETKRFDAIAITLPDGNAPLPYIDIAPENAPIAQAGRNFLLGAANDEDKLDFDEQTWRAGFMYDVTADMMGYFTVSRGFKSGGFDLRITQNTDSLPKFQPEFVKMYEVGLKSEFPRYNLRLNTALFWSEYNDIQVSANPPGQINTVTANAADGRIRGIEVEGTWIPVPALLLEFGAGFQDSEYQNINPLSNVEVSLQDNFIRTPRWSTTFGASYRINLADTGLGDIGTLTPRVDWNYRSSIDFEPVNQPGTLGSLVKQDNYHVVNVNVGYRDPQKKWLLRAGVNNLTNTHYFTAGDSNGTIGYALVAFARSRNWFASLELSF